MPNPKFAPVELKRFDHDLNQVVSDGQAHIGTIARNISPEQLAAIISDFVNCSAGGVGRKAGEKVGKALVDEHPSLQRAVLELMFNAIATLGQEIDYTDARNAVAIESARKIARMLDSGELKIGLAI